MRRNNPLEFSGVIWRLVNDMAENPWEWDDIMSVPADTPVLRAVQDVCHDVYDRFPSPGAYCSAEGMALLLGLAAVLQKGETDTQVWIEEYNRRFGRA